MASLKKFIEKIEAENEIFEAMSKAEKRVRIAEDCIERIKLKIFEPNQGNFISPMTHSILDLTTNLKDAVNNSIQCSACAKGGLFLTYVGRVNNFESCKIENGNNVKSSEHRKLLEIFTASQLAVIEYAFEGSQHLFKDLKNKEIEISFETENKIRAFYRKYDNVKDRMIGICENIIKNKGTFKP